jgi:hypothetical protein
MEGQPNMEGLIPITMAVAWMTLLASTTLSSLVVSSFELLEDAHSLALLFQGYPPILDVLFSICRVSGRPLQGFLKCTKIGGETAYNLEFKLPPISEHLRLTIDPKALEINHFEALRLPYLPAQPLFSSCPANQQPFPQPANPQLSVRRGFGGEGGVNGVKQDLSS